MKRSFLNVAIVLLMLPAVRGQAATFDTLSELRRVTAALKKLDGVSYKYTKAAIFPNGDRDSLFGQVQIDNSGKVLLNDCNAFTMIYTGSWFYKADHRKKTIIFLNLKKNYDKQLKKKYDQEIFGNMALGKFFDSVLLKTATVKEIKQEEGRLTLRLAFPKTAITKYLSITYNTNTDLPEYYSVETYQVVGYDKGVAKAVSARIACSNFKKLGQSTTHTADEFFEVKKGELSVKKFSKYKISSKL